MKPFYRTYVRRASAPADWELVGSTSDHEEAHEMYERWIATEETVEARLDVEIAHWGGDR